MTSQLTEFKRVLVGLPQTGANLEAVNAVADLAEFLHIELLATFVTDSSLHTPAGFPAVRELRIPDHGWQTIDLAQIRRDIDRAAAVARQRFYKAVGNRTIKTGFDIVTGTQVMASLIRADDIVAIIEPTHPGDRVTLQFTAMLDAALASARAILVLPQRIVRTSGPVMALASGPEDASIRVALAIAATLKESLIVVARAGMLVPDEMLADARELGVQVELIADGGLAAHATEFASSASRAKERLRVVMRSQLPADAPRLFSMLHAVPLLVVEPIK